MVVDFSIVSDAPGGIRTIEVGPEYWLVVIFADGRQVDIDLGDVIRRDGPFQPLRDRRLFARVRTSADGQIIEWPEPSDQNGAPLLQIDIRSLYAASEAIAAKS